MLKLTWQVHSPAHFSNFEISLYGFLEKRRNMKKFFYSALTLSMLCTLVLTGCGNMEQADPNVNMSVRQITSESTTPATEMLSEARSAVVGISVNLSDGYAIGSGVAITDGGLILTNNHVVEGGRNITLYYADKTTGTGKVLWTDPGLDLAVVRSSRQIPYLGTYTLPLEIGEEVYALGTPLTLEFKHSVTHGIVSATNRTLEVDSSAGSSFLQSLIQHDAPINPGNSGGPLINARGQVVGINTLKATEGEGIGFAVPIEIGKIITEQLKEDAAYSSPYIGVFGFDSDIARAKGENFNGEGVYVVSVDGPAVKAGLKKGDLVTKFGDFEVKDLLSLRKAVLLYKTGDSVLVKFTRAGSVQESLISLQ